MAENQSAGGFNVRPPIEVVPRLRRHRYPSGGLLLSRVHQCHRDQFVEGRIRQVGEPFSVNRG